MGRRLFVSIDLPDSFADAVKTVQDEFRDAGGLTFVDPAQAHVTLKFLGDTPEKRIGPLTDELRMAIEEAGVTVFEATYSGLGVFPSPEYIRVVWLGVEQGGAEMVRLHEAIEERTVAMGFQAETHEFTPHVTLARMQHASGKELVQQVVSEREPVVGTTQVGDVRLTESELGPDGPVYSTVERFEL